MCFLPELGQLSVASLGGLITSMVLVAYLFFAKTTEPDQPVAKERPESVIGEVGDVLICAGAVIQSLAMQDSAFELYFGIKEEVRPAWVRKIAHKMQTANKSNATSKPTLPNNLM